MADQNSDAVSSFTAPVGRGESAGGELAHSNPAASSAMRGPRLQFVTTDVTVGGKTKHDAEPEVVTKAPAAEQQTAPAHSYELADIALPEHGVQLRQPFAESMAQAQASPDAVRTAVSWWADVAAKGGTVHLEPRTDRYSIPSLPHQDTALLNHFLNKCHAAKISNADVNSAINFYFRSQKPKR